MAKYSIDIKKSKKGSLHTALGIKQGDKIPASKLQIKSTDSPALKKKKQFAINAKKFKHQTGGDVNIPFNNNYDDSNLQVPQDQVQGQQILTPEQENLKRIKMMHDTGIMSDSMNQSYNNYQPDQQPQRAPYQIQSHTTTTPGDPNDFSPFFKATNSLLRAGTFIGNTIGNIKNSRNEYQQYERAIQPHAYNNIDQEGLNNNPIYTKYGGEMKNGGLTSAKAKEILHDGTANGKKLTDKQRRFFGAIASGETEISTHQTGGMPQGIPAPPAQQANPDEYYGQNATLQYFKEQLNDKLKAKNPTGYGDYFKGLQQARMAGNPNAITEYEKNSQFNDYLSPDEVKSTLGNNYDKYINSLKTVNQMNVQQGKQPLYGNIEGDNDLTALNYGRRFASLQTTPRFAAHVNNAAGGSDYSRQYSYNPQTGGVDIAEEGDLTRRPSIFKPAPLPTSSSVATNQMGGYAEGEELDLTPEEIEEMIKQGYEFEHVGKK